MNEVWHEGLLLLRELILRLRGTRQLWSAANGKVLSCLRNTRLRIHQIADGWGCVRVKDSMARATRGPGIPSGRPRLLHRALCKAVSGLCNETSSSHRAT